MKSEVKATPLLPALLHWDSAGNTGPTKGFLAFNPLCEVTLTGFRSRAS